MTEKQGIQCGTPAEFKLYLPESPLDPTFSCRDHLADMVEDGDIVIRDFLEDEDCCFYYPLVIKN
jgi:hypothetical protein